MSYEYMGPSNPLCTWVRYKLDECWISSVTYSNVHTLCLIFSVQWRAEGGVGGTFHKGLRIRFNWEISGSQLENLRLWDVFTCLSSSNQYFFSRRFLIRKILHFSLPSNHVRSVRICSRVVTNEIAFIWPYRLLAVNFDNTIGAVGFIPRLLPASLFPIALIKYDEATGEPIRNKNGLCIRTKPGRYYRILCTKTMSLGKLVLL